MILNNCFITTENCKLLLSCLQNVTEFRVSKNLIENIDISQNNNLEILDVSFNLLKIESLHKFNNSLKELILDGNDLKYSDEDASKCTFIENNVKTISLNECNIVSE